MDDRGRRAPKRGRRRSRRCRRTVRGWTSCARAACALQGVLGALLEAERQFQPPASPARALQQITTSPEWAWLQPLYRLIADLDHALAYAKDLPASEAAAIGAHARELLTGGGGAERAGLSRSLPRASPDRPGSRNRPRRGAACAARRCHPSPPISPRNCTRATSGTSGGGFCDGTGWARAGGRGGQSCVSNARSTATPASGAGGSAARAACSR